MLCALIGDNKIKIDQNLYQCQIFGTLTVESRRCQEKGKQSYTYIELNGNPVDPNGSYFKYT